MSYKLSELEDVVGTLSKPSKMPCHGYSIPAVRCITGAKLRNVKGSVCSKCYALKGRYVFGNTKSAMERRYVSLSDDRWVDFMSYMIEKREKSGYFRWHDSGDIQSIEHLHKIVQVAERLPHIKFWLPTREYSIVEKYMEIYHVPDNLTIRLSGFMIDGPSPDSLAKRLGLVVSGVSDQLSYTCPSNNQGNKCMDCRACWDKDVFCVSYRKH